ncbi:hypothetical protein DFJ77DRAFT_217833 [Powellomyces hirtus]|nr:hypothetical protein DFJ77DRAFT_217833 [Powellomyces hirtus]
MVRAARLFLFTATSLLIILALAYAIFAYTVYLKTSPFPKVDMFPADVLLGIAVLAPIMLITSLTACGGLYRLSIPHLHFLIVALVISIAAHVVVAQVAFKDTNTNIALSTITHAWSTASNVGRVVVENDFECCGWEEVAGLDNSNNSSGMTTNKGRTSDGKLCMQTRSCQNVVVQWRTGTARMVGRAMYAVVAFLIGTAVADILLLRTLHRKEALAKRTLADVPIQMEKV